MKGDVARNSLLWAAREEVKRLGRKVSLYRRRQAAATTLSVACRCRRSYYDLFEPFSFTFSLRADFNDLSPI